MSNNRDDANDREDRVLDGPGNKIGNKISTLARVIVGGGGIRRDGIPCLRANPPPRISASPLVRKFA